MWPIGPLPACCSQRAATLNRENKETPGRLPPGRGTPVGVRLQPAQLEALDAWIDSRNAAGVFSALKACRQWASAEAEC
jgi:hypothetical protein